jgi:pimeloyl-ACP methyl ester carboxylesterase
VGGERAFARASLIATYRSAMLLRPVAGAVAGTPVGRMTLWQVVNRPWRIPADEAVATVHALAASTWFRETLEPLISGSCMGQGGLDVPLTIAWGQHDRLLLMRQARRAAQRFPQARMVTLYGCGHVPTYDDPEQVAEVLLAGSSG